MKIYGRHIGNFFTIEIFAGDFDLKESLVGKKGSFGDFRNELGKFPGKTGVADSGRSPVAEDEC